MYFTKNLVAFTVTLAGFELVITNKLTINKKKILFKLIFTLLLFEIFPAHTKETFKGNVINVVDGDTLDIRIGTNVTRIRLADIDAPERNQPWGHEAKKGLISKVLKKEVSVVINSKDRYGRLIGTIFFKKTNVNQSMISEGHAWAYRQYLENKKLIEIENKARKARVGLWQSSDAIPPWDWRKGKRNNINPAKKAHQPFPSNNVSSPII